jgi:hypothetical protein
VITDAELRRMTPDERRRLARALAAIDLPRPLIDPRLRRRRRFGLMFMLACCLGLAAWIAILIATLPGHYTSRDWRGVWVGLDGPGGGRRGCGCHSRRGFLVLRDQTIPRGEPWTRAISPSTAR